MEAEVRRHNSVLRWDLQLILCPRERGCIAVPEAAVPAGDVFHIAVQHFPYDWQSTLAPDSGCDLFFPPILSAHWSLKEYHGPVCSTKLWAGERFRQPQNAGEHGGWREASSALWAKDTAGFLAQCTLQDKDKPQRGLAWGRFGWHHSWRAMTLRMKSWKLFTTFTKNKKPSQMKKKNNKPQLLRTVVSPSSTQPTVEEVFIGLFWMSISQ